MAPQQMVKTTILRISVFLINTKQLIFLNGNSEKGGPLYRTFSGHNCCSIMTS